MPLLEFPVAGTASLGQRTDFLQLRLDAGFAASVETVKVVAVAQTAAVGESAAFAGRSVVSVTRHGGVAWAGD